ncbi:MAG: hypothetical protein JWM82_91, partial [Myxococcales bacterium]|nr:hypothetical protein [Myxococcales bacterium]
AGGVLLLVLMVLAGSAGYVAVKYRVWQDSGPVVARAQELLQSLRTLAPWAAPDTLARPNPPRAQAVTATPRLAPEVVPITRDPEPAKTGKTGKAGKTDRTDKTDKTEAKAAAATQAGATPKTGATPGAATPAATTAAATTATHHHSAPAHRRREGNEASQKTDVGNSDPTEEELLAPSANTP